MTRKPAPANIERIRALRWEIACAESVSGDYTDMECKRTVARAKRQLKKLRGELAALEVTVGKMHTVIYESRLGCVHEISQVDKVLGYMASRKGRYGGGRFYVRPDELERAKGMVNGTLPFGAKDGGSL